MPKGVANIHQGLDVAVNVICELCPVSMLEVITEP